MKKLPVSSSIVVNIGRIYLRDSNTPVLDNSGGDTGPITGIVQSSLYRNFIGYHVTEGMGGPIHFSAKALRVSVD